MRVVVVQYFDRTILAEGELYVCLKKETDVRGCWVGLRLLLKAEKRRQTRGCCSCACWRHHMCLCVALSILEAAEYVLGSRDSIDNRDGSDG